MAYPETWGDRPLVEACQAHHRLFTPNESPPIYDGSIIFRNGGGYFFKLGIWRPNDMRRTDLDDHPTIKEIDSYVLRSELRLLLNLRMAWEANQQMEWFLAFGR